MKFGKSYYTATTSLPEEWRQRAIDYKQLKKLINRVVLELEHLGLNPAVLQRLLTDAPIGASNRETILDQTSTSSRAEDTQIVTTEEVEFDFPWGSGVIYEIDQSQPGISDSPVVHLRLPVVRSRPPAHLPEAPNPGDLNPDVDDPSNAFVSQTTQTASESSLPRRSFSSHTSLSHISTFGHNISTIQKHKDETSSIRLFESVQNDITSQEDVVIPLTSDSAFLHLLSSALVALSTLYQSILVHCETQVQELTTLISSSARPRSQGRKSDLDTWRTIFQLWVDTEIFESLAESSKGELPVHESDERLRRFMDGIVRRGYTDRRHMRISSSREALDRFCALNVLLLDLKKFQQANLEATRKILKKHQKRTSLPSSVVLPSLSLTTRRSETLPHAILLTMTQTLLPIIPSIDDYQCLICTSIAFKPIRLACGHLFCVRCLVKMQRKGSPEYGNCPLCRAPTVFQADRSNLDVALMNFMEDWFPMEIKVKVKENADEVAREMARDLGMDGVNCIVM